MPIVLHFLSFAMLAAFEVVGKYIGILFADDQMRRLIRQILSYCHPNLGREISRFLACHT
nr:hypothetical protein [Yoonia sp.]